jgi:hypothetical protein
MRSHDSVNRGASLGDNRESIYDPFLDRHEMHTEVASDVSTRNIKAGEEILNQPILTLRAICRGKKVGSITLKEVVSMDFDDSRY